MWHEESSKPRESLRLPQLLLEQAIELRTKRIPDQLLPRFHIAHIIFSAESFFNYI